MSEIMIYSNIEPISWDAGVSQPPKDGGKDPKKKDRVDGKLEAFFGAYQDRDR